MRLGDMATVYPRSSLESVNHYTVQRELDIAANVDGRDLGSTAADIQRRSTTSARACRSPRISTSAARTR
jgi:Cu/Ag efflux pump CusA